MTQEAVREKAHHLIDDVHPEHLAAVVSLLEILAPMRPSSEPSEYEDERISQAEHAQAAAATGPGIPFDDILAEYGLTLDGILSRSAGTASSEAVTR